MRAYLGLPMGAFAAGILTLSGLVGHAGAAQAAAHPAYPAHPVIAYVANNGGNMVTPVNAVTGTALNPIRVGSRPYQIEVTSDGKTAYVSTSGGVVPVNTSTQKAGKAIRGVFGSMFGAPVVAPDGKTLYGFSPDSSSVIPVSTATNKAGAPIKLISGDSVLAITPDGKTLYFASSWGMVYPISTATRKAGKAINFTSNGVSDAGIWIAMTPNGKTVYVSGALSDTVIPINTATNKPGKPIGRGEGPLFVTPNGKTAYVVVFGSTRKTCATVTAINTATNKAGKTIKIPGSLAYTVGLAITPDSRTAYVTCGNTVTPIRVASSTALRTIRAGCTFNDIAITPNGKTAYATCDRTGSRGQQLRGFVIPISTATNTAGKAIKVGHNPGAIAITP